ncbi:MAG: DUF2934 domain-containing protein [Dissulfurispiraceae bacterium]|jgi:hypothetical protein
MDYRQEIEIIAFELYQLDGCIPGRELDHWLRAEVIFHDRNSAAAAVKPSAAKKTAAAGTAKKKVAPKKSKVAAASKSTNKISAKAKPGKSSSSQKEATL